MSDPRDYKLDLTAAAGAPDASAPGDVSSPSAGRPYVSVHFTCCNVYLRIYRSADGRQYRGRCPRCGVPVTFAVGQGGTSARTFVVR